jgi:hypothetical protein
MSFLKVKKKPKKELHSYNNLSASTPNTPVIRHPSPVDNSVFSPGIGDTKKMSLADTRLARLTPGVTPAQTPLPSRSTSLNRVAPPPMPIFAPQLKGTAEEAPALPTKNKNGIGGTLTSQPPLRNVFDDKSDKSRRASVDSGFFARVASLTKGRRRKNSEASDHRFNFDTRSFNEDTAAHTTKREQEMLGHSREPSQDDAVRSDGQTKHD